jgi:hypothetical protein
MVGRADGRRFEFHGDLFAHLRPCGFGAFNKELDAFAEASAGPQGPAKPLAFAW